jgi:secreted PhoX family phosphatase
MKSSLTGFAAVAGAIVLVGAVVRTVVVASAPADFGAWVQDQLQAQSADIFGFEPLEKSATGPYNGADNTKAIQVANGLLVSLVSSSSASATDQIAFWPDSVRPRYLFVCDEETTTPAVQRIDLRLPPGSNATTIVAGLQSCDPVRRTPWGTIIVAEEAGSTGGLYELLDPANINQTITVLDRDKGVTSDPAHLVKRQAVGSLSFESFAISEDGTMIFGDELAPSGGNAGGGIYKFVPTFPFDGGGPIGVPSASPLDSGKTYGLRVAASKSSNWGQGAETGAGAWVEVNLTGLNVVDANGNVILRNAQLLQRFTGYYRPEDMDVDPIALKKGLMRACWTNTGRMSHAGGGVVENGAVLSEVMCLSENPPSDNDPMPATGTIPTVVRFIPGSQQRGMYDNVAFQPKTGNLAVVEDGPTSIVKANGVVEPRGNDLWLCLPDGKDDDQETDGCVRFGSVRDTTAEPTGIIFFGSGEEALVSIQHRKINDDAGSGNHGAILKISGFRTR